MDAHSHYGHTQDPGTCSTTLAWRDRYGFADGRDGDHADCVHGRCTVTGCGLGEGSSCCSGSGVRGYRDVRVKYCIGERRLGCEQWSEFRGGEWV